MLITIVTAVYNREDTVAQAVASVRDQTYPFVEHVVIDGGSSDTTLARIKSCRSPRVVLRSGPDKGIYDALNKGITLARGEVVGLMHSDDYFSHRQVIERVAKAFTDPELDLVYGDLDYVSAKDPQKIVRKWRSGSYSRSSLARGWMPPHPTVFARRRVIEQMGSYDTSYRIAADYDAILRWFGSPNVKCAYLPEVLVKMRIGGESNRSLDRILLKSREDLQAMRTNGVGGIGTLLLKNARKFGQFI